MIDEPPSRGLTIAAHQPAYLPWLGYLAKVAACDRFVVMDDLQYEAQNFQNRNRVKVNNGVVWLTVPLVAGRRDERICDKRINNQASPKEHWQRRSWQTLKTHYGRAPCFERYATELEEVYTRRWERLVDLDLHILQLFLRWFGISRPLVLSSTLGLEGQRTDRLVDLCRRVGASVYLSGSGGSVGYLEEEKFTAAGLRVTWQKFRHPVYPQRYTGFAPNLSALDMILNCGPQSGELLLGQQIAPGSPGSPPSPRAIDAQRRAG